MLCILFLLPALAAPSTQVAARDGANLQRPSWSPDGRQLSYEANFHDKKEVELYVGDPHKKTFRRVQPVVRGASSIASGFGQAGGGSGTRVAHELSWSPANIGRYVYTASTDKNVYDLYMMNGSAIAPSPATDGGAAWSPDGKHLVFSSARTGQGDLYHLEISDLTAPPRRLTRTEDAAELFATWSPDSRSVAFVGKGKSGDNLFLLPDLTSAPIALTAWSGTQTSPSFSPDGKRIAFYANRDVRDRFDLHVVEARSGATPIRIARDVVLNRAPMWTPDGQHLIFVCNDDDNYDPICRAPVRENAQVEPLELGTVGHGDLDLTQGPDGNLWLAFTAQGRTKDTERSFKRLFIAPL
ncbi:MAG: hypothetical protein EA397_11385 [Deltaproteobacteria bacterium]|nr:MAG: hypothetical protein EA397_11385 [Deltaproteobacteria bacterium]